MRTSLDIIDEPIYFEAAGNQLFGILSRPSEVASNTGVVLVGGGEFMPSFGRNRTWVSLAREAAAKGFPTLRIDYRGVGESTGVIEDYVLGRPFFEDVLGGVECLHERGLNHVILIGSCFGARVCLAAAEYLERLEGLFMISSPVVDSRIEKTGGIPVEMVEDRARRVRPIRGLLRIDRPERQKEARRMLATLTRARLRRFHRGARVSDSWVSPSFIGSLDALGRRSVPVLLAYGLDDAPYRAFRAALAGRLGEVIRRHDGFVRLETLEGEVHAFMSQTSQDAVHRLVLAWLEDRAPGRTS